MASANIFIISARMSCSEKTAEKRSVGLSCAKAGKPMVAAAAVRPVPTRKRRRVVSSVMLFLPVLARSEEHTSELQSLMRISYAVFCLKKKKKQNSYKYTNTS